MEIKRVAETPERLREAMEDANKKQVDLARETGLDKGAISSYLSGKYEPKAKAIGLMARALGVSEMWLWGYDVEKKRSVSQKENDEIVDLVTYFQSNPEFREVVSALRDMPEEEYNGFKMLILSRRK